MAKQFKLLQEYKTHRITIPAGTIGVTQKVAGVKFGEEYIPYSDCVKYSSWFKEVKTSFDDSDMRECWDTAKMGIMDYDQFMSTLII